MPAPVPQTLVVGSVALDSIETPHGAVTDSLGGSASYSSCAASYFANVGLVGVVGHDFPAEHLRLFRRRGIDLSGLQKVEGLTFRWSGYYDRDLGNAHTNTTALNVFEHFNPVLTEEHRRAPFLFLANISPELQLSVLNQMHSTKLVVMDTMNFWIEGSKQALTKVIRRVDVLLMNESEARQYVETTNLIEAGNALRRLGPRAVIIKKGEHGSLVFLQDRLAAVPAYPLKALVDPTGAGDTFAGSMVGYLSRLGKVTDENLIRGVQIGTAMASFTVMDFSLKRLVKVNEADLKGRLDVIAGIASLPPIAARTIVQNDPKAIEAEQKPARRAAAKKGS